MRAGSAGVAGRVPQDAGAGVLAGISPPSVAGLGLWIKATSIATSGSTLTAVTDLGPSGHSLSVTGSPQVTGSNADFGGAPTIAPNGGLIGVPGLGAQVAHTVIASVKLPASTGTNRVLFGSVSGEPLMWAMTDSESGIAVYDGALRATAAATNDTCVLAWRSDPSVPLARTYRNGSQIGESAAANSRGFSAGADIFGSGATAPWAGSLHELAYYSRPLTSDEIAAVSAYMGVEVGL